MAEDTAQSAPAQPAIVVGGGISGLVAARELAVRGFEVTVLEAAGHWGGCVYAHELDGLTLDAGAESFATKSTAVPDLLKELGLDSEIVIPRPGGSWLYTVNSEGAPEAFPSPKQGLFGIPAAPTAKDVVVIIGEAAATEAARDLEMPVDPALLEPGVSLGQVVRARMGEAVLDRLVTPVVAGVLSAHPDFLDCDAAAPGLRAALAREGSLARAAASLRAAAPAGSAVGGLVGGMQSFTRALVSDLEERGAELLLNTIVESVTQADDGSWRLETGEDSFATEHLVIATDGPTAAALLPEQFANATETVDSEIPSTGAPIALVTLVLDAPLLDQAPRGTGLLVAPGTPGVTAKALTHASAKWQWLADAAGPGTHVVRLSFGRLDDVAAEGAGSGAGSVSATSEDEALVAAAIADASTLLGVSLSAADVLASDVVRFRAGLPFARPGHRQHMASLREQLEQHEGLHVVGAWIAGTGLAAVVADTRRRVSASSQS